MQMFVQTSYRTRDPLNGCKLCDGEPFHKAEGRRISVVHFLCVDNLICTDPGRHQHSWGDHWSGVRSPKGTQIILTVLQAQRQRKEF